MAGLILYLYQQGYRNFLFFVNSTTIINKTKENFLNPRSIKYLFADTITIADKRIQIKEVEFFQTTPNDDINILFTTVQGLHSTLNTPRENAITYDDFEDKPVVMIADEAHHINALTKKNLSKEEKKEKHSWESTVQRVFNSNLDNILLEFTATADLDHPKIAEKYGDKLLFDYPLRQFRLERYSKDVQTLQADLDVFERSVQAILLSQYRRKLFEKHGLLIKPVVLFKSEKIDESKAFQKEFTTKLNALSVDTLKKIKDKNSRSAIKLVFDYCSTNNIDLENLIQELRNDFSEDKQIAINSKEDSEEMQIAVNTLEDANNEYRAIFAVDKLNEGWDVLNLFDIVRLYEGKRDTDTKTNKPGTTTMQEAQLIGRGARYCPFRLDDGQELYKRKYDEDLNNEMRLCEVLYYHASYNPRYIAELNNALFITGIKSHYTIQRVLKIKESFTHTNFYGNGLLFKNDRIKNSGEDIFSLTDSIIEQTHEVKLHTGTVLEKHAFIKDDTDTFDSTHSTQQEYKLVSFGTRIIRKALDKLEFYNFDNLQNKLPNLKSFSEFITSDKYLGKVTVNVQGLTSQVGNLSPSQKVQIAVDVLNEVAPTIAAEKKEFSGTTTFKPYPIKSLISDKVLNYTLNDSGSDKESGLSMDDSNNRFTDPSNNSYTKNTSYPFDLSTRDWYAQTDCFGTSEEKALIRYIDSIYDKLSKKYDEIYLVRNEKFFQIYNFDDGRPFEPDFVLFLSKQKDDIHCQYQIFIEPKGEHLYKTDEWKEQLLLQLKEKSEMQLLWKGKEFNIWGLPFYNHTDRTKEHQFKESLKANFL